VAVEYSAFAGWKKNLKLANDSVELIVTLEAGPRIISRVGAYQAIPDFCRSFETFLLERIKTGEWLVVIAEMNGQLAGCAYLQKIAKLPRPGRLDREYGCITLCVRKQYRGHGLRGQLLQEITQLAKSEGLESLVGRPNTETRSMYRGIGFRQVEPQMELDLLPGF
jgi:GNAT superfamily N-acetyltransferase